MRNKNNDIESILKEIQQLNIIEADIKERINAIATAASLIENGLPSHKLNHDRNKVQLGDKVIFLTKGKYISTGSFVKRLSRTQNSFVAVIDEFGNVIQQKSCSIRVVEDN